MPRRLKTRSITVIGRRWFDRINGNSYFTAIILVNGIAVCTLPYQYGYGDQYSQEAGVWLQENKYLPKSEGDHHTPLWRLCGDNDIALYATVTEVARKKDL